MCSQRCVRSVSSAGGLPNTFSAVWNDIQMSGSNPHVMPRNVAGSDADDRDRLVVQPDGRAGDARVGAERSATASR